MKYVFWGSPRFAKIVLEKLIEAGLKPEAVICNPDRPFGRKKIITPPPVKILAKKEKIKVWQPKELDEKFKEKLKKIEVDIFVVAAYAKIISDDFLKIPSLGAIGVHPSLLPDLRGATPIQTAILRSYLESGVSLYIMDKKMDHGPILGQKRVFLGSISYLEAEKKLAEAGGELLIKLLPKLEKGEIEPKDQKHDKATFTKKIKTEDGEIKLEDLKEALNENLGKAEEIKRKVLALNLEPGIYVLVNNKRIKILKAEIEDKKLVLKKIQIEGKKPIENFDISAIIN